MVAYPFPLFALAKALDAGFFGTLTLSGAPICNPLSRHFSRRLVSHARTCTRDHDSLWTSLLFVHLSIRRNAGAVVYGLAGKTNRSSNLSLYRHAAYPRIAPKTRGFHCSNLKTLKTRKEEGVHLEITDLIIPGANDSEEDIKDLVVWINKNIGDDAVVHFSRYFPAYKMQSPPTPLKTLLRAREIALGEGSRYVYIGNRPDKCLENTFCSNCGALLVRRTGYSIIWEDYRIQQGGCPECREKIYGVWK